METGKKMTVAMRLGLSFAAIVLMMLLLVLTAVFGYQRMHSSLREIVQVNNAQLLLAASLSRNLGEARLRYRDMIILQDQEGMLKTKAQLDKAKTAYNDSLRQLAALFDRYRDLMTPREAELFASIQNQTGPVMALIERTAELGMQNRNTEAAELMQQQASPAAGQLAETVDQLVLLEQALNQEAASRAEDNYETSLVLMSSVLAFALLFAVTLAVLIIRNILKALGSDPHVVADLMRELAAGNLMIRIPVRRGDETSLAAAISQTVERLRGLITEVRSSADNLSSAAQQVSATSQSLSQTASETAASVEETSASVEEMSASIDQARGNARVTENIATKAARRCARRRWPCGRSPTRSALLMTSPIRPICWH